MSNKRIYRVNGGTAPSLVKATSKAQAINHIVKSQFKATVATQGDLVELLGSGAKVENAE